MTELEKELELVNRAKNDLSAFSELYEKYFDRIYAYVLSMVQNHELCEDIVSETFEKCMKNLKRWEYKGYSFGAWIYRIARNTALDKLKSQKNVLPNSLNDVILIDHNSAEDVAQEQIEKEHLWEAIMKLDEDNRELVVLRFIEGYSVREVADIMGRTENAIKSATSRSIKKLKTLI